MRLVLLALVLVMPGASAAALYADGVELGAHDATVRLVASGEVQVHADAPVEARVEGPASWHGLSNVTVVRLHREDGAPRTVEISDAQKEGVVVAWPGGGKEVPAPGALLGLLGVTLGVVLRGPARGGGRRGRWRRGRGASGRP